MTTLPSVSNPSMLNLQPTTQATAADGDRLREAANGFEGLFLQQMLKTARQTSFGDDLFSSSAVEKTRDLFDMEITKAASQSSGLGISDAIYRQLSPLVTKRGE